MENYLKNMEVYQTRETYTLTETECQDMKCIWNNTQRDPDFLENNGYMEISMLKFLNKSPLFLQTTSVLNMTSPMLSFFIPVIMLIVPFIILHIQGVAVNFQEYISVLSHIAKRHFIGMAIHATREFNVTNSIYFVGMFFLYVYQMYANYTSCIRFYSKMREMNTHLLNLKKYTEYVLESTVNFMAISHDCEKFKHFHMHLYLHKTNLQTLHEMLKSVYRFEPSLSKITQLGYMQQCYHEIYNNRELAESIAWSFGFQGYLDNLRGIYENLKCGKIAYAIFDVSSTSRLYIQNQKYVPIQYMSDNTLPPENVVGNDCALDKNILITGPNAAGKTTYLKSTLLNVLFSQQLGCGYYTACRLNPYCYIHSYLNIPDTSERDSLFQAESRRCKQILDSVVNHQERQLCVFDELYSGTNPEEATKSSYAFLKYLARYKHLDFILTTHYVKVCKKLRNHERIKCCKMEAIVKEDEEIEYTYKMKNGISKIQGAYSVLKQMNYPTDVLSFYHEIKTPAKLARRSPTTTITEKLEKDIIIDFVNG